MEGHHAVMAELRELRDDLNQRHSENVTRHDVTDRKVDEAIRRIDDLHKAFPGGDWDGHRRYHESVIGRIEARTRFYEDLRGHLIKNGMWAFLIFLAWAAWQSIKTKVTS